MKLTKDQLELMRKSGYSEKAIEYFRKKVNIGRIEDADEVLNYTGSCGDTLKMYLKIYNGVIEEAKFQCIGCLGAVSSASAITELAKGKTLKEAMKITEEDILNKLGGLPESKLHCTKLAVTTLRKAIREFNALESF